jgi:UDP-N-acetylmuramoyl-L-alanyl-D-glutamate--2,6-diaminopimelate ligase
MILRDLAAEVPGAVLDGPGEVDVRGVTLDSRRVGPGDLYVAIRGKRADGLRFAPQAIAAGAAAVAVDADRLEALRAVNAGVPALGLPAPRADMATLAAAVHGWPGRALTLVGVTGTNGKTTVTWLVSACAAAAGWPEGLIGTVEQRVGPEHVAADHTTPESSDLQALLARMVAAGVRSAAIEVSSVGVCEHRIDALDFDVAVFLNLDVDHLDYHGTLEAYADAKAEFFRAHLAADGVAIIDVDDPRGEAMCAAVPAGRTIWRLSLRPDVDAEVRFDDLTVGVAGIAGRLVTPRGTLRLDSPLTGRFNASNVAAAAAAALAAGVPAGAVEAGLQAARVPGRFERVPNGLGLFVVVDYAHTADAIERVVESLRAVTAGQVWCVFGCGGDRDASKRGPMGAAAASADAVVVTSDNPRGESPAEIAAAAAEGAIAAGRPRSEAPAVGHTWVELDRRLAIAAALAAAGPGDAVLIAGKGHERYQEVAGVRTPFDDVEVAREALEQLREVRS